MGGGSTSSSTGAEKGAPALMRDRATLALMEWVGKHGGKVDNLGVATVGPGGLRGVVALKVRLLWGSGAYDGLTRLAREASHDTSDPPCHTYTRTCPVYGKKNKKKQQPFKKGEALISIPYELALDVTPAAPGGITSKLVGGLDSRLNE